MSTYLNEDYLFFQTEDYLNKNTITKAYRSNSLQKRKSTYKSKSKNQCSSWDKIVDRNVNTTKNSNFNLNNEVDFFNQVNRITKIKNNGNNNIKYTDDFYEDTLSQIETKSPNNYYCNFEDLINEDDKTFSFEFMKSKNQDFMGNEINKTYSEKSSDTIENFQNIHSNSNSTTCNFTSENSKATNGKKNKRSNNANIPKIKFSKCDEGKNADNLESCLKHNERTFSEIPKKLKNYATENLEFDYSKNKERQKGNSNYSNNYSDEYYNNEFSNNSNFLQENKNNEKKANGKNKNYCKEGKKSGKWSDEEDRILYELVPLYGAKNWKRIADNIKGRSPIQCLHRWTKILQPGLVKGPWTIEEDRKLLEWVKREGPVKWTQCSDFIKGRNGKQCRERWFHTLNPQVIKGNWSSEEDLKIFTLYKKLGGKWSKIALSIQGRTENSIKNRFYSTLRRKAVEQAKSKNISNNEFFESNHLIDEYKDFEHSFNAEKTKSNSNNKKKGNQSNNFSCNYSLKELLDFLPQALLEVRIKYMKEFNLSSEDLNKKEGEILEKEILRAQKKNAEFLKEKLYEENLFNKENCKIANNNIINNPQTINFNLNFNSNQNNFILDKEKMINDTCEIKNNNTHFYPNDNSNNNIKFKNNILDGKNDLKINNIYNDHSINPQLSQMQFDFSNTGNDYKNMDLFSLENNILDMCDNPNFMLIDNNFSFLDNHVDNIIDNMFLNNNIILTNDDDKDCIMCFNLDKKPAFNFEGNFNKVEDNKVRNPNSNSYVNNYSVGLLHSNNYIENPDELKNKSLLQQQNNENFNFKNNQIDKNLESEFIKQENSIESQNNLKLGLPIKIEDENDKQANKKNMLSSLINQLEDLEKLVKNTKKELMKFNEKGVNDEKASEEAILTTTSLTNTIQKLFK